LLGPKTKLLAARNKLHGTASKFSIQVQHPSSASRFSAQVQHLANREKIDLGADPVFNPVHALRPEVPPAKKLNYSVWNVTINSNKDYDAKQGKKYYKDIESFYWMKIINDKIIGLYKFLFVLLSTKNINNKDNNI
jgi:hypothetical protein